MSLMAGSAQGGKWVGNIDAQRPVRHLRFRTVCAPITQQDPDAELILPSKSIEVCADGEK